MLAKLANCTAKDKIKIIQSSQGATDDAMMVPHGNKPRMLD